MKITIYNLGYANEDSVTQMNVIPFTDAKAAKSAMAEDVVIKAKESINVDVDINKLGRPGYYEEDGIKLEEDTAVIADDSGWHFWRIFESVIEL